MSWLAEGVDGSNVVAPVDEIAPETAASLKGSYRQTSPEGERIMRGVQNECSAAPAQLWASAVAVCALPASSSMPWDRSGRTASSEELVKVWLCE